MAAVWFDKSKFEQEAEVQEEIKDMIDNLPAEIAQELDNVMQKILSLAIELCPKDTGALASSINLEGGAISEGNDFYNASIYAGSEDIINPKTGKPTSEYAMMVHEGHFDKSGKWVEGIPFLEEAMMQFEDELEDCIARAMSELEGGWNNQT
jgi:hypothetical protein